MGIIEYIALFSSTLLAGLLALRLERLSDRVLKAILAFGGAYILGITFLHLIPEVFYHGDGHIGFYVLVGFLLQLLLELLSKGVEHGHMHALDHHGNKFTNALSIMIGLCVHAFIEGIPLEVYESVEHVGHTHDNNHLLYGIMLHKIPAAFTLSSLLLLSGFKKSQIGICLFLFASMSPLGAALFGYLQSVTTIDGTIIQYIMAIVIGSFLHISTTILFETDGSEHHHISASKLLAISIGIALSLITLH